MTSLLPIRDAAKLLGLSEGYMHRLAQRGQIPFTRPPCGCRLFDRDALEAWRMNRRGRPPRVAAAMKPVVEPVSAEESGPVLVEVPVGAPGPRVQVDVLEACLLARDGVNLLTLEPGRRWLPSVWAHALGRDGLAEAVESPA